MSGAFAAPAHARYHANRCLSFEREALARRTAMQRELEATGREMAEADRIVVTAMVARQFGPQSDIARMLGVAL